MSADKPREWWVLHRKAGYYLAFAEPQAEQSNPNIEFKLNLPKQEHYMPKSNFPLCKAAGLKVEWVIADGFPRQANDGWYTVRAEEVEAMLAQAPVVFGEQATDGLPWRRHKSQGHTHCARLVCIESIRPADALERLWDEMYKLCLDISGIVERNRKPRDQDASTGRNPSDSPCAGPRD